MSPREVTTPCCNPDTLKELGKTQLDKEQTPMYKSRMSFQILRNAACFWLCALSPWGM